MTARTTRRLAGVCALVVAGSAAYTIWELIWASAGLGAFAEELSSPRPSGGSVQFGSEEAHAVVDGFAGSRLNRLTVFVAASGACLTVLLSVIAVSSRDSQPKDLAA